MDDSRKQPDLETLSYKPPGANPEPTPSAPMGFNSVVIKPETRVNKVEDVGQLVEQPKPTIAELEEILERNGSSSIEIMPNGEIRAKEIYCSNCGNPKRKDRKGLPIAYCGRPCPPEQLPGRLHTKECECGNCPEQYETDDRKCVTKITGKEKPRITESILPTGLTSRGGTCEGFVLPKRGKDIKKPEQPNQNLMIITEIEGLISQANKELERLDVGHYLCVKAVKRGVALEEIDLFQKTTLFELRKAFE